MNEIKSTFPHKKMTLRNVEEYLKNNNELTILSSYALFSISDCIGLNVYRIFVDKNEYGGTFGEYFKISKIK